MNERKAVWPLALYMVATLLFFCFCFMPTPNIFEPSSRSQVSRAKVDLRSISIGVEAYAVDHGRYPFPAADGTLPVGLTTPIAYITQTPRDVFKAGIPKKNPLRTLIASYWLPVLVLLFLLFKIWKSRAKEPSVSQMITSLACVLGAFAFCTLLSCLIQNMLFPRGVFDHTYNVANPNYEGKNHVMDYMSDGKDYYAIRSVGPDGDADLPPDWFSFTDSDWEWELKDYVYDATNGSVSGGDIIRYVNKRKNEAWSY